MKKRFSKTVYRSSTIVEFKSHALDASNRLQNIVDAKQVNDITIVTTHDYVARLC